MSTDLDVDPGTPIHGFRRQQILERAAKIAARDFDSRPGSAYWPGRYRALRHRQWRTGAAPPARDSRLKIARRELDEEAILPWTTPDDLFQERPRVFRLAFPEIGARDVVLRFDLGRLGRLFLIRSWDLRCNPRPRIAASIHWPEPGQSAIAGMHSALAWPASQLGMVFHLRSCLKASSKGRPSMSSPIGRSKSVRTVGAISIKLAP